MAVRSITRLVAGTAIDGNLGEIENHHVWTTTTKITAIARMPSK